MNKNSFPSEDKIKSLIRELLHYREINSCQSEFGILSYEDGHMLQMLIEISGAKNALEIGTSIGVSGLWISLGLLKTGGRLTTIELLPEHARKARENFRKVGVENIITVLEGCALGIIPLLKEKFDFVFSDAYKKQNLDYFNLFINLVTDGGIIVAHDSISEADNMHDYLEVVKNHRQFETVIIDTVGSRTGMVISYKKINHDFAGKPNIGYSNYCLPTL